MNTKYIEFMIEDKMVFYFFHEVVQHIEFAKTVEWAFHPVKVQVLSAGQASIPGDSIKLSGESFSLGICANREAKIDPETLHAVIYNNKLIAATDAEFLSKVLGQQAFKPELKKNEYSETYLNVGKRFLFY